LLGTRDQQFNPNDAFSFTGSNALQTLASGQFQEWQLGVQSTMTIGFRKELAQVRHYQLQLARERAKLQDEELEISHQLADAVRQLEYNYAITQTNFNRTLAADKQVEAQTAAYNAGTVTLDQLLEAQRRRAEAQASFFRTLLDYQRAIITVHYRKGSLLEYNNVYLQEGPWPEKAQFDAHRLARQRDAAVYLNYGYTRPGVLSEGAVRQNPEGSPPTIGEPGFLPEGMPTEAMPEELPLGPSSEMLPEPTAGAAYGGEPASPLQSKFSWGPLGLGSESQASKNDTWSRLAGMPENVPAPSAAATAPAGGPTSGAAVQAAATGAQPATLPGAGRASRANLQQPRSMKSYESNPDQSLNSDSRAAANF
jgi:hypothetical protein